jgi:hypothetical protein
MADVNVTVMIDGKAAFVAGAAGAPDPHTHAVGALQYGLRHFQDILASRAPAPSPAIARTPAANVGGITLQQMQTGQTEKKDSSL